MATVTAYTAAHMDALANANIVNGYVSGDNLILVTREGTLINAGNVRGAAAPAGNVVVCTSTSRPSGGSLFEGLVIYETDTDRLLVYNGIRFNQAWNYPWGLKASHTLTTSFTTAATHTTLQDEGLTFTLDETANRRASLRLRVNVANPGGPNGVNYRVLRNGVVVASWAIPNEALNPVFVHSITFTSPIAITTAGVSVVYRVQMAAIQNNTSVYSYGDTFQAYRTFEYVDEGPAGVPA